MRLGTKVTGDTLEGSYDAIVLATGVLPRKTGLDGEDGPNVVSYVDVLRHQAEVGSRVVIVGAGGIGYDVAEFLVHGDHTPSSLDVQQFLAEWGIDPTNEARGGIEHIEKQWPAPARHITVCQRSAERPGKKLGKTTGWIHRATLKMKGVRMIGGVNYEKIDDEGLHISYGEARENPEVIECDNVVLCAGQLSERTLADALEEKGVNCHVIGGADVAAELDAKRAINQGTRLAASL